MNKRTVALLAITIALTAGAVFHFKNRPIQNKFAAARSEAPELKYMVIKENTLMAVTGNLHYYGVIKDEEALLYALEHTKDEKPGREGAIKVGNNDIDTDTIYTISQTMDTWEIARILLNEGIYSPRNCGHGGCGGDWHPFTPALLPGGDIAPTWKEQMQAKYSWVKNYDDCVKAIGHDGGQVTSEEASKRTGHPRVCNTADGRYFIQGKEGQSDYPPYP